MRCPKCHYISFDDGERCRNCGYDFSLTPEPKEEASSLDLAIHAPNAPIGPLADLDLGDRIPARQVESGGAAEGRGNASRPTPASDLPLFTDRPRTGVSPGGPPPVHKQPLSVRKSSALPKAGRSRTELEEPTLDLDALEAEEETAERSRKDASVRVPRDPAPRTGGAAGLVARLFAGMIDTTIMVGVHGAVLYFTLRLCGLTVDEIAALPPVPILGFLLLLTGGYFVGFTAAGGQTIGKMAAGIRVVADADPYSGPSPVPLGTAVLRAAAYIVSVLPAGAGLLPALFSPEHRALHDRLADTRVVKA